ncbi:MAG: M3 family metallopeptidase [Gammaproteobacteria bacterium]|nr:M3 family metallopeptidase [Gammaproteobacteria bacterium]
MKSNPLLDAAGLPAFHEIRPEHVEDAVLATLDANRAELERLLTAAEGGQLRFDDAVLPIERLGDRLHRVWSPVRHLQSVANSPELRAAYNACLPAISRYETELGHNQRLYELYRQLGDRVDAGASGEGGSRLLELAIRDFRLAGVHLPPDRKARFKAIMEELATTEAAFEQNVLDSAAAWSLHISDASRVRGVPPTVLEPAAGRAREAGKPGWIFHLDQPTYVGIVTHADDRELRRSVYRGWVTRASDQADFSPGQDNTAVMDRILALRHEAAGLIGYPNFAAYSLATKMARSVDEVRDFLVELVRHSRDAARGELAELEAFAGRSLEPWDIAYWSEKLRHRKYSISDEALRPYFPLPRVLAGLCTVVERLYGIRIEQVPGVPAWEPHVEYYRLVDPSGREIGGFFTDFYARSTKRSGAWMDQCLNRLRDRAGLQVPVAHLVCNFSAPTADQPCLITHDEMVTVFHEMGHVLHHLLTRIDYPSVGGINGVPWDAVELPSQFMETFAWEPEVVALCSGHYQSGEPLPGEILASLRASKNFQSALQMVRQLEFALFDLRIHAEYDPATGARVMDILAEVRDAVAVIRPPEWNRFAHAFTHIFGGGYAAGYYSYKWAEVLAADAFAAFEESGLFNPELARRFREQVLEIGGSRDIGDAFVAFRGRPAHVDALLKQSGIERAPA